MGRVLRLLVRRAPGAVATVVLVPVLSFAFWTIQVDGNWQLPGQGIAHLLPRLSAYMQATFLHFELGRSVVLGATPVKTLVVSGFPVDVALLVGGLTIGVAGGVLVGRRRGNVGRAGVLMGISTPVFVSGIAVLILFSHSSGKIAVPFVGGQGDYAPPGDDLASWLRSVWVPCLCLAAPVAAMAARVTDRGITEELHTEHVRAARARGISERRLAERHAFRPVATAVAGVIGARMGMIVLDLALVEYVFNLPGSFRQVRDAVLRVDLPVVQAMVLVSTTLIVVGSLIAEAVVVWIDPRVDP